MTIWSRYVFGVSIFLGIAGIVFADQMPGWWGPASILLMVLAAAAFLIRSVIDYRRVSTTV